MDSYSCKNIEAGMKRYRLEVGAKTGYMIPDDDVTFGF